MKKIIDLIEKYFELDDNAPAKEAVEARDEWADTIWHIEQEIGDRVARRRKLESTPITEDWLKEHGFKNERAGNWSNILHQWKDCDNFTHTIGVSVSSQNIYNTMEGELSLIVNADSKGYLAKSINTLADLYDACSLCGITMED